MSFLASRPGRALMAAVWVTTFTFAVGASAQPKSATDEARELAKQGWAALDAQNYKEALDKVIQAEALYHAPIHLLVMGSAQVGLGKLAEALSTFERLAAEPLPTTAPTAFKDAQETGKKKMKELLSRVPSLLVAVENSDAAPSVTVDGKKMDFSSGVAVRIDPGDHTIEVSAEGYETSKTTVKLPEKGGVVRVPVVLSKPRGAGSASASASSSPSAAPSAVPSATTTAQQSSTRVPAYIALGVAGATIIVGSVTGGMSLAATGDLKTRCPNNTCAPADQPAIDSANVLANTSTAMFVIGGVAAAAGIVLLAVDVGSRPSQKGATGVRVEPWVSVGGGGLRGRF